MFLRRVLGLLGALLALTCAFAVSAKAEGTDPRLMARLNDEQRRLYLNWRSARAAFERKHEAYWAQIVARRSERRRVIAAGGEPTAAHFVMQMPPKYAGPALRADIQRIQAGLAPPPSPESEITTLPEMLAAAHQYYKFKPALVSEREFKRRYAVEALAVGLSPDAVYRIYAFETGGRGTFDMQAGINPETKAGRAISTAMGYAQLLAANSIDELTRSGDGFISRLGMMAARPGTPPQRVRELTDKIEALRAMLRVARSVPKEWSRHVELARTPKGYGIHVLNLDADIGPWLQVIKLKGVQNTAEQAGLTKPTPAQLEIMNLAGPRTGLEMMHPAGRMAPTANFFTQAAYYRNTIVREKTAGELLAAIDQRMTENMARPGSIEFAQVFEEVAGPQRQVRFEDRQQLLPPQNAPRLAPAQPVPAARVPQALPVPPAPVRAQPQIPRQPTNWAPPGLRPQGFPD